MAKRPPTYRLGGFGLIANAHPANAGELARAIADQGLVPVLAFSREQLFQLIDATSFALILVDLGLAADAGGLPAAGGDGPALVQAVAERTDAVLLVLSPAARLEAKLLALGADAVLAEDAATDDISAAAVALVGCGESTGERTLEWGPLMLDVQTRGASWNGRSLPLTKLQFRLLATLVEAKGGVVSRDALHRPMYGAAAIGDTDNGKRIVAHVRRIRQKIEADPSRPTFLLAVRGEGFRLADHDSSEGGLASRGDQGASP